MIAIQRVFDEGYTAHGNGLRQADNPYADAAAQAWDIGWRHAAQQAARRARPEAGGAA